MSKRLVSRRDFLKTASTLAGGAILAACAPQTAAAPVATTEPEVITVKETVIVEGEAQTVEKIITATAPPREAVEITWWQAPIWRYAPDNTTVLGPGSDAKGIDLVERFQEANPWVTVKMELIPWDQWGQKTTTGFASGDVANVMYSVIDAARVASGLVDPLDDYLTPEFTEDWLPGLQTALTYNGRVYGIPMFVNPFLTAFSQTSLEKWGVGDFLKDIGEDRGNVTPELMWEYGLKYTDKKTRYFWGVPTDHGSILYWMFGSWLEGWGVKAWDDAEERWQVADFDESVQAFEWLSKAADEGILPPGSTLPKWSDCDNFFWAENMAARLQWPGMQAELEVAQEAGQASKDFKLFYAAFPHKEGTKPIAAGTDPIAYSIGRTNNPAEREASFLFAKFMAADPSNAAGIIMEGVFPSYKSSMAAIADHPRLSDPNIKWIIEQELSFKPEIPGANYQPKFNARSSKLFNELDPFNYFVQQFQSLMLKQKTAKQMLDDIARDVNTKLGAKI